MAGFLNKLASAGSKLLQSKIGGLITKGVTAVNPAAGAALSVVRAATSKSGGGAKKQDNKGKPSGDISSANLQNNSASRSMNAQDQSEGMFKRFYNWLKGLKDNPEKRWLFWLIVIMLPIMLVAIIWLTIILIRRLRRGKRSSSSGSRSGSRSSSSGSRSGSRSSSSGSSRKASPKQLAALARGRAKLKAKRK